MGLLYMTKHHYPLKRVEDTQRVGDMKGWMEQKQHREGEGGSHGRREQIGIKKNKKTS